MAGRGRPAGRGLSVRDRPAKGEAADAPLVIDTRPLIRAVAEEASRGVSAALIARRFHSTLVDLIATVCGRIRQTTGIGAVVLSGGVFLNALLTAEVVARLTATASASTGTAWCRPTTAA